DGWSLVHRLRTNESFATLPIIVLTALSSPEDRVRAFRLGADDFVTKPFSYEELDLRVALALRRNGPPTARAGDEAAGASLHGRLEHVTLPSLLILIDQERKTGRLCVRAGGELAEILVRHGQVVQAALHGKTWAAGPACVYHAMRWREGEFDF